MTDAADLPPQPLPNPDTIGFWQATAEGRLAICRCAECGTWMHPPLERCRQCGGATRFETVGGTGTVHSFIVLHRASVPGQGPGPHVLAAIDLDGVDGARLTGRVLGAEPIDVRVGMRVAARIVAVPGGDYFQPEFEVVSGVAAAG